jgi:hypothetical protein
VDFQEFTDKFRGGTNPDTGKHWVFWADIEKIAQTANVTVDQAKTWVAFWWEAQTLPVGPDNRPTNAELVVEWKRR